MRLYGGSSPVTRLEDSLAQIAGDNGQISGIPVEKLLAGFSDTDSDRSDALSVFGSFEARVGGNAGAQNSAGASLGFGKLFATGVAAQNLSVGVDDVAVARAGANCLVSMNSILSGLPEAERTAGVVSALAQVCGLGDMEQTAGYGGETPPGTEAQPPEGETEQQPEGDAGEEIVPDPEEPNTQV
ncbi:hypothetical protein [Aurantiacibacter sp. D1-12]|uniref:hypothetical protein n=1 Tax=Aurantiacibacter sp. D1-12 TaxID=2993658 RepID=UPI00237C795E|nr:hypothetical protein [Aurantiacibacter sp. D1-12]